MLNQLQHKTNRCLLKNMAFILTATLLPMSVNAQIIYKDILPDTTIKTDGGAFALDLNNDGTIDFNITYDTTVIYAGCPQGTAKTGVNISIRITPLGSNAVGNDTIYPGALLLNANIDHSSFKWNEKANQILNYKSWQCRISRQLPRPGYVWTAVYSGRWNGAVNKYIPLKLVLDSNIHYGWVRLDVTSGATAFTVKDYAYNTVPFQIMHAGETTVTGIVENAFSSSISVFPNPSSDQFTIALGSSHKQAVVRILDMNGKVVYSMLVRDPQKFEINLKAFAEGIYIVQVQADDHTATKKLALQR